MSRKLIVFIKIVFFLLFFIDIYEELNFGTYLSQLGGITSTSIDEEKGPNDNGMAFSLFIQQ